MTSRSATVWGGDPLEFTASYANNKKTGGNEVFDFEGNVVDKTGDADHYTRWKFDASGVVSEYKRAYQSHETPYFDYTHTLTQATDGDGQLVKRLSEMHKVNGYGSSSEEDLSYYVRSSVLGGRILTELNAAGAKIETKVYLGGAEIALQRPGSPDQVLWKHVDPITGSRNSIQADGNKYWGGANNSAFQAEVERLSMGDIPTDDPYPTQTGDPDTWPMPTKFKLDGNVFNVRDGCHVDGIFHDAEGDCIGFHVNGNLDSAGQLNRNETKMSLISPLILSKVSGCRNAAQVEATENLKTVFAHLPQSLGKAKKTVFLESNSHDFF